MQNQNDLLIKFKYLTENFGNKKFNDYLLTEETLLSVDEWLYPELINILLPLLDTTCKPKEKEYSLLLIKNIVNESKFICKHNLIKLIPAVSDLFWDTKEIIRITAKEVLFLLLECSENNDLIPFLNVVMNTFENPETTPEAIDKLASCVFVQNVECAAITIIEPILVRGLKYKINEVQRKTCVIIDNMCKLVEHPKEILPLVSKIKPLIEYCAENISDPEARVIANKALSTLVKACGENNDISIKTESEINEIICKELNKENKILSKIIVNMCNYYYFEYDIWLTIFNNYLDGDINNICENIYDKCKIDFIKKEEEYYDTETGLDLYRGTFSLAYGSLTLLNNCNIHLKRNRFYGLLGPNNCGKTTLMRAIANEQVEGFPKKNELRTIFVEHEIQEREVAEDSEGFPILNIDLCGVDWVVDCCNNVYNMEPPVERKNAEKIMEEIGFGNSKRNVGIDRAADCEMLVTTYSGGWKMKMQLCAATLMNSDILMLDEPTGHLDTDNVKWIKNYLNSFIKKGGSVITTSHEPDFLNEMCTHIIDFNNRKLRTFKGKKGKVLKEFVEKYPEKQGYFELKNDVTKFVFPEPGNLEGVKSLSKSILKMNNVVYQYETRNTPTIQNINLECSRVSRVAVIGANGAGKTTAIKVLNGELKPTSGTIVKHPNLRLAYVAQHAFHHLEKHINKTPTEYILWRFAGNEDRENLIKVESTETEDKIAKYFINTTDMSLKICSSPEEQLKAIEAEYINARRDNKKLKTKDYQVKWKSKSREDMIWVTREILIKMGAVLLVQRFDEKEAAASGLQNKTLTSNCIEKYLQDFSIEPEQASHTQIGSLSGGQKVKIVIAASLWQNPHLIILDEPTNYLDRDGLGALTKAIEEFKGGVIIISHNKEFANAVAQEKWIMKSGNLRKEGESIVKEEEKINNKHIIEQDTIKDAYGNEIKVEKEKILTGSEKKNKIKKLQKQLKEGIKNNTLTEDEQFTIEDEIETLKN